MFLFTFFKVVSGVREKKEKKKGNGSWLLIPTPETDFPSVTVLKKGLREGGGGLGGV